MPVSKKGWIGVDYHGTLAMWRGNFDVPGVPIPRMVDRVRGWLRAGYEVKVFTALASYKDLKKRAAAIEMVEDWCESHIGQRLEVTAEKDFNCIAYYDDKAVGVIKDTGMLLREKLARRG